MIDPRTAAGIGVGTLMMMGAVTQAGVQASDVTLASGLDGPRAVADGRQGRLAFSLADGSVRHVVRLGPDAGAIELLAQTKPMAAAPAVDFNSTGKMFILTSASRSGKRISGAGVLYGWHPGPGKQRMANISRYQAGDPDPFNVEGARRESNPYAVAGLASGGALVADAAGNDLLRVSPKGRVVTVARVQPRKVRVPSGLGASAPPAGTRMKSEAVITSVTVGPDGAWYIGELRGFPSTPGKSQIWRIKPGTKNAVCRPSAPNRGPCRRYADGFTSIVELDSDSGGLYVVELSKKGWLQMEMGVAGSHTGSLFRLTSRGGKPVELMAGQLHTPGGVAHHDGHVYVSTGSLSGSGQLLKVH